MGLAERLQQVWYGTRTPPWWTLPLEALYQRVVTSRMPPATGAPDAVRLTAPVVVVGNITAGGTGKTPLTLALVDAFTARGWMPGVVSRGFGGSQRDPALVPGAPDPAVYGDEPSLMKQAGAMVAVGRDRPAAAQLLLDAGCDLVIADDGLQHYRLARDVEICVIDGERRFGNRRLLPAGPLREPLARLERVDFLVCNGGEPREGEVPMHLAGTDALSLLGRTVVPLASLSGRRVHAVAGIGHPGRFFASIKQQGIEVVEHPFDDHHRFAATDFSFADDDDIVLMTSKDAVKCMAFARANWFEVPVVAQQPMAVYDAIERIFPRIKKSHS